MKDTKLNLTDKWDKVFPKSDKVEHRKITFHNRYGITLAADLYKPLKSEEKLPAIAISSCGLIGDRSIYNRLNRPVRVSLIHVAHAFL